jgi:hypothetical protein
MGEDPGEFTAGNRCSLSGALSRNLPNDASQSTNMTAKTLAFLKFDGPDRVAPFRLAGFR